MSGERADRMSALAARAGARIARIQGILADQYFQPGPETITWDEVTREIEKSGHMYDENCDSPFCRKYRQMFAQAAAMVMQQAQQPAGGA